MPGLPAIDPAALQVLTHYVLTGKNTKPVARNVVPDLFGIAWLSKAYGVTAMEPEVHNYQSVLSILTTAVFGRGWFYYLTMGSVLLALSLSAIVDVPETAASGPATSLVFEPMKLIVPALSEIGPLDRRLNWLPLALSSVNAPLLIV